MKGRHSTSGILRITKIIKDLRSTRYEVRFVLIFLIISVNSFGQTAQKEIDEQVWKVFIKGFDENNADLFMSVHSKDLIRSPREAKKVLNWDKYYDQTKKDTHKHTIELRFTERVSNDNQAIDVGIYKTSYPGGSPYYGRFHVVLRKENGVWKILVDTDSSENETIGEDDFLNAPLVLR